MGKGFNKNASKMHLEALPSIPLEDERQIVVVDCRATCDIRPQDTGPAGRWQSLFMGD